VHWLEKIREDQTKAKSNEGNKQTNEKLVHDVPPDELRGQ
jgi:hypothetical protein